MGATALVWLFVAGTLATIYLHHIRLNQIARLHARRYCEQQGLQMLDQSAVLCHLGWSAREGLALARRYRFEFSLSGGQRYNGWITMQGSRIVRTETQPVRDQEFHR